MFRGLFTEAEFGELIKREVETAEATCGPPDPGRSVLDDLVEWTIEMRVHLEAGEEKQAIAGIVARAIRVAILQYLWPTSSPRTDEMMRRCVDLASELARRNRTLLQGSTPQERLSSFDRLRRHVEGIWLDSVRLYEAGSFPRACFLAIACLEEVGKSVMERVLVKSESVYGPLTFKAPIPGRRPTNPFYQHTSKHVLSAVIGVLFNWRLPRLLGEQEFNQALEVMESGKLVELRESSFYVDSGGAGVEWPEDSVTPAVAWLWVVVSGEAMVEVLGYPREERERLLTLVEDFEARNPRPS